MLIKIHKSLRHVVAICDSNLIGKKFEEGKKQLEIRENFYNGNEIGREEAIRIIKAHAIEDATFNIVGKEAIGTALEAGIINKKGIHKIRGIPFALVLL
jgi:hypothetical protein